jgi:integrase
VFDYDGRKISDQVFYRTWRRARKAAALRKHGTHVEIVRPALLNAIPHDLRRAAATSYRRKGHDSKVIRGLLGWSTDAMFARYNIATDEDAALAVADRGLAGHSAGHSPLPEASSAS